MRGRGGLSCRSSGQSWRTEVPGLRSGTGGYGRAGCLGRRRGDAARGHGQYLPAAVPLEAVGWEARSGCLRCAAECNRAGDRCRGGRRLTGGESRANRSTIQLLFLGLAGLTLLVFGLSYGLFHHLATRHEAGVFLNRENAEQLTRVDRLENAEAELDAPGNDIFLSRDVERERKRVVVAGAAFRKEAQSLRKTLRDSGDSEAIGKLDAAVYAAAEVENGAYQTIDAYSRADLTAASQAMASMDQAHIRVFDPLQRVANALRAKESLA